MIGKNHEQWINIRVSVKISKSPSEALTLVTLAYGEYTMKKSNVFQRYVWFKEEREDVQDDPRSGQPKMQMTDANVDRVLTLVHSDRRLGVKLLAEELNMGICLDSPP
jgi:hypothetical protein